MGLEGNLKDFDLADILQLISFGKKTGALDIKGEHATGVIYFDEGTAVHSTAADVIGDEAVGRILRWRSGSFAFKPDVTTDQRTVQSPIMHLVLEAARQIDEWQDIQKLIPSLDLILTIEEKPPAGTEDIQLQPLEWRILALVDGNRPINQIIKESHLGDFETCKVLYGLLSSGLIKVLPQEKPPEPQPVPVAPAVAPVTAPSANPPKAPLPPVPKPEPEKKGVLGSLFGKKR